MAYRFRSLLFRLDPEMAHRLTFFAARLAQSEALWLIRRWYDYHNPRLSQSLWGLPFSNPVGLAAGFDKNARLVPFWEAMGFGFCEVGSISAQPSKGNPRPRLFRLPQDEALINRMGLNNEGAERIASRLHNSKRGIPMGVNLAKTHRADLVGEAALEDFRASYTLLAPHADYIVLNISCPNTAEGKTFEEPDALDALLRVVNEVRRERGFAAPILLKLSPPPILRMAYDSLTDEVIDVGMKAGVAGFVATNTASDRMGLATPHDQIDAIGRGGLSGKPLQARSRDMIRYIRYRVRGKVPIISVGGVDAAEEAYARIRHGASLVQVYTGLVYHGPALVKQINAGLSELLQRDGFTSITQAIGVDA